VVSPFNPQRYLGTWYEIARFDHHFESGLKKLPQPIACATMAGWTWSIRDTTPTGGCGRKPTAWLTLPGSPREPR
jgi:apolipoprotein D and lipocalin family protein